MRSRAETLHTAGRGEPRETDASEGASRAEERMGRDGTSGGAQGAAELERALVAWDVYVTAAGVRQEVP